MNYQDGKKYTVIKMKNTLNVFESKDCYIIQLKDKIYLQRKAVFGASENSLNINELILIEFCKNWLSNDSN